MVGFLHAADFHLDSPFAGLSPERAAERRRENRALLGRMAEYVRCSSIDLVLLSGDLFDSGSVYQETWEQLSRALGDMGCPVFIAPGNHDFWSPSSPYARGSWPDNVHVFSSARVEAVPLPELGVSVCGAAFTAPEQTMPLLEGFRAEKDGLVPLMVLHGDLGAAASPYNPISHEQVSASGLTYLALGHIHQRSEPARLGATWCAYPGCPGGRGFDELGGKGLYQGTIDGGDVSLRFVPFAQRRYESLEVDVSDQEPAAAVEAVLPPSTERDLYRIALTGETDERGIDLSALQQQLGPRFYDLELRDRTRIREDVWARAEEDSLRGLFLRELREKWDRASNDEERETVTRAVRFGLAALDHRDLV